MSGTKAGGLKAAATNKAKYGDDFYVRTGRQGGLTPTQQKSVYGNQFRGFATNFELARLAGAKGGRISRKSKKEEQ